MHLNHPTAHIKITSDTQKEDNHRRLADSQQEDSRQVDSRRVDSRQLEEEDNRLAAHMQVEDIQH